MGRGGGAFQWWGWAGYQVFVPVSLVRILDVVTICTTGARRIATGGTNCFRIGADVNPLQGRASSACPQGRR
ncbi:hypothetical protein EWN99_22975 [Salmonella enterica]|nr:hypothetical protein [Salmonella enterica]EBS3177424.1 hypothetical protein [Salmonella enterica subsp. enterica serovar Newport]EDL3630002.1 hypothetical protein [Salmonella enterica subsp. enterica serovar Newport]EGU8719031.1 hypothetical protein [Salmonella enterica]